MSDQVVHRRFTDGSTFCGASSYVVTAATVTCPACAAASVRLKQAHENGMLEAVEIFRKSILDRRERLATIRASGIGALIDADSSIGSTLLVNFERRVLEKLIATRDEVANG